MGQMEMKCIFNIGKYISIWAKVTQASDLAHGRLVVIISALKNTWPFISRSLNFARVICITLD
jgi:hypothetical protein